MHKVWLNQTAVIQDAVAIALHYKFEGWFIDYEPEYPSVGPDESQQYSLFLDALSKELHKHGLSLTFYVTGSWDPTSSNYALFAGTSVDELHSGLMYAGDEWPQCEALVGDVRGARKSTKAAGIGLVRA